MDFITKHSLKKTLTVSLGRAFPLRRGVQPKKSRGWSRANARKKNIIRVSVLQIIYKKRLTRDDKRKKEKGEIFKRL